MPDWMKQKLDEYITDHFYAMESTVQLLNERVDKVYTLMEEQQARVEEYLQQIKTLIELQYSEAKKGKARDAEVRAAAEGFQDLKQHVYVKLAEDMKKLSRVVGEADDRLGHYDEDIMSRFEEKLVKRDDVMYKFEADLARVLHSFTSLRLEFNKEKKAQDFKVVTNNIFLLKSIDHKPEERKHALRLLQDQEEKLRGHTLSAEREIRSLARTAKDDLKAVAEMRKAGDDPMAAAQATGNPLMIPEPRIETTGRRRAS